MRPRCGKELRGRASLVGLPQAAVPPLLPVFVQLFAHQPAAHRPAQLPWTCTSSGTWCACHPITCASPPHPPWPQAAMDRGLEALRLLNTGYAAQLAEMRALRQERGDRSGVRFSVGQVFIHKKASGKRVEGLGGSTPWKTGGVQAGRRKRMRACSMTYALRSLQCLLTIVALPSPLRSLGTVAWCMVSCAPDVHKCGHCRAEDAHVCAILRHAERTPTPLACSAGWDRVCERDADWLKAMNVQNAQQVGRPALQLCVNSAWHAAAQHQGLQARPLHAKL